MMTIEKFGVRVSNPDCLIEIDGQSFAELICYQHLHTENLKHVVAVLNDANPDGCNESCPMFRPTFKPWPTPALMPCATIFAWHRLKDSASKSLQVIQAA